MHYNKEIETSQGIHNFYINRIETAQGMMFHISVVGKDNKVCMFLMEKHLNRWYIKSPVNCPEWIVVIEPILSDYLKEIA